MGGIVGIAGAVSSLGNHRNFNRFVAGAKHHRVPALFRAVLDLKTFVAALAEEIVESIASHDDVDIERRHQSLVVNAR